MSLFRGAFVVAGACGPAGDVICRIPVYPKGYYKPTICADGRRRITKSNTEGCLFFLIQNKGRFLSGTDPFGSPLRGVGLPNGNAFLGGYVHAVSGLNVKGLVEGGDIFKGLVDAVLAQAVHVYLG